jgi:PAS domain S-box-containing protein
VSTPRGSRLDPLGEQLRHSRRQVEALRSRAAAHGGEPHPLFEEALEALYTSIEEMQVTSEELRRQNEELARSRADAEQERLRYRELFQHAPDPYFVTDLAGVVREANHAAAELLNVKGARLMGKPLGVFVPPEARREFRLRLHQVAGLGRLDGWDTWVKPRRADVVPVACTVTVVRGAEGEPEEVRWLVRDRTERMQAADARRAHFLAEVGEVLSSSLDYDEVLQQVARLCAGTLADYCIVHVEEGEQLRALAVAHADRRREEMVRGMLRRFPDHSASHPVAQVLRTGTPEHLPYVDDAVLGRLCVDESHREMLRALGLSSALVVPIRGKGKTLGALSLARAGGDSYDAADLETAEEVARRAALAVENASLYRAARQAVTARDEMVAVLSHDLRNPLNAVLIAATVLTDYGDSERLGERDRKQVDVIRRSAEQMTALVNDLLEVSALESGTVRVEARPTPAATLLAAAMEMFTTAAEQAGVVLTCEPPDSPPPVLADYGRMLQVVSNVVGNALKFTPSGGAVTLGAERAVEYVRFWVRDTGPGIAAEHLPKLFDRFWQARRGMHGGTGLGLAIARSILEAHGGQIWVESERGAGSTFHFTLPVAAKS